METITTYPSVASPSYCEDAIVQFGILSKAENFSISSALETFCAEMLLKTAHLPEQALHTRTLDNTGRVPSISACADL